MTVVPEVDSPGHNNAIIMSEYDDTANPLLNGHPQDINCSVHNPPRGTSPATSAISALCPESENTWTILHAIISQLTAMSPEPVLRPRRRRGALDGADPGPLRRARQRGAAASSPRSGKTPMGWAEIAGAGTTAAAPARRRVLEPGIGLRARYRATATDAVAKDMKLVMAPANHAYLDQKYAPDTPPNRA